MATLSHLPTDLFFGFDDVFNALINPESWVNSKQSYPPYNVIKKDENHYLIEIAVAGFNSNEINLTLEKGILTVSGEQCDKAVSDYIHKGISTRNFKRSFRLADTIEVIGADVVDGLLLIALENKVPEEEKPKTIELGATDRELLLG